MPYCENCGNELNENANFCPNCGKEVVVEEVVEENIQSTYTVSTHGVIGFIMSLVLFFGLTNKIILWCVGIPAIVFSILGINDKKNLKHGFAVAGLIIAIISMFIGIFAPPFIRTVNKAKQESSQYEQCLDVEIKDC